MKPYTKGFILASLDQVIELLRGKGARALVQSTPVVDEECAANIASGSTPSLAVSYRWRCGDSYDAPMFTDLQLGMLNMAVQAFQMRYLRAAHPIALWVDKVYHVRSGGEVHDVPWIKQGLEPYYRHEVVILDKCVSRENESNFWTMAEHTISYSSASGGMKLNMKFGSGRVCEHEECKTDFHGSLVRVKTLFTLISKTNGKIRFRDDDGEITNLLDQIPYDVSTLRPSDTLTYIPSAGSGCANRVLRRDIGSGLTPYAELVRFDTARMISAKGRNFLVNYCNDAFECESTQLLDVWHVLEHSIKESSLGAMRDVQVAPHVLFGCEVAVNASARSSLEQAMHKMVEEADWRTELNVLNSLVHCGPNNWAHVSARDNYLGVKLEPFGNDSLILLPSRLSAGIMSQSKKKVDDLDCNQATAVRLKSFLGSDEIETSWVSDGLTYLESKKPGSGDKKQIRGRDGLIFHDVFEGLSKSNLGRVLSTYLSVSKTVTVYDDSEPSVNRADYPSLLGDPQDWNKQDWAYIVAIVLYKVRCEQVAALCDDADSTQDVTTCLRVKGSRHGVTFPRGRLTALLLLVTFTSGVALITVCATVRKFSDSLLEVILAVVTLNFIVGPSLILRHYEGGTSLLSYVCGRRLVRDLPLGYQLNERQSAEVAASRWLQAEDNARLSRTHSCYLGDMGDGDVLLRPLSVAQLGAAGYSFARGNDGRLIVRKGDLQLFWDGQPQDLLHLTVVKRDVIAETEVRLRGDVMFGCSKFVQKHPPFYNKIYHIENALLN